MLWRLPIVLYPWVPRYTLQRRILFSVLHAVGIVNPNLRTMFFSVREMETQFLKPWGIICVGFTLAFVAIRLSGWVQPEFLEHTLLLWRKFIP